MTLLSSQLVVPSKLIPSQGIQNELFHLIQLVANEFHYLRISNNQPYRRWMLLMNMLPYLQQRYPQHYLLLVHTML